MLTPCAFAGDEEHAHHTSLRVDMREAELRTYGTQISPEKKKNNKPP